MKYHVTLKTTLARGTLYWVTDVDAKSEDEALVAAEHRFEAEIEEGTEWSFHEFDVEKL